MNFPKIQKRIGSQSYEEREEKDVNMHLAFPYVFASGFTYQGASCKFLEYSGWFGTEMWLQGAIYN